jgi:hypothetical protein
LIVLQVSDGVREGVRVIGLAGWLADGASAKLQTPKMLVVEPWWTDEIFIA